MIFASNDARCNNAHAKLQWFSILTSAIGGLALQFAEFAFALQGGRNRYPTQLDVVLTVSSKGTSRKWKLWINSTWMQSMLHERAVKILLPWFIAVMQEIF